MLGFRLRLVICGSNLNMSAFLDYVFIVERSHIKSKLCENANDQYIDFRGKYASFGEYGFVLILT